MLNLARKWRSKHFEEIVGQPLVVRLLKNSLYRGSLFPVYLLSGTRGCGKTSIARIFAAALNCEQLEAFQKNPQLQIPCLACASCTAMRATNHPDFIELDAASHTGVDNVREIIDAAACIPVMGKRKIYLIDEAHMLSKAAFNALLKILEEPPQSVVFMLATTDPHKILETVTSRCFQLFFDPISSEPMIGHLQYICAQEGIKIDADALKVIAHETEGSLRDALNLLERLRIAYPENITKQSVIELLGSIDDEKLSEIFELVVQGDAKELLAACARLELHAYNAQVLWKKCVEYIRLALWLKNEVLPADAHPNERIQAAAQQCSYERLIAMFALAYDYELAFAKTTLPGEMLEMMLLKMAQVGNESAMRTSAGGSVSAKSVQSSQQPITPIKKSHGENLYSPVKQPAAQTVSEEHVVPVAEERVMSDNADQPVTQAAVAEPPAEPVSVAAPQTDDPWAHCVKAIESLEDPLVISLFKQGTGVKYDPSSRRLEIIFSQDLSFFKDWLENTKKSWEPHICNAYGEGTILIPHFVGPSTKERPLKLSYFTASTQSGNAAASSAGINQITSSRSSEQRAAPSGSKSFIRKEHKKPQGPREQVVNVSNDMPLAQLVTQAFPGTVVTQEES